MAIIMQFPDYDFDKDQEVFPETPSKPKLIDCPNCKKIFFSKQNLELHQIFQHKILLYKCPKKGCIKSFLREEYLKEHVDMVHKRGKIEKPYKCEKAQKCINKDVAFRTQGELNQHLKRHDPKIHACDTCGKAFAMKGDLENHLRIHTGEKIYSCRIKGCNETFISSSKRLYHEKKSRH
jgi:KRAB domain-containing zinc finger protein